MGYVCKCYFYSAAGVPDTPQVYIIESDRIATWRPVNSRGSPIRMYNLTAIGGMAEETITIFPQRNDDNLTQDLSHSSLNLDTGETYQIYVVARNDIGYSTRSDMKEYTHRASTGEIFK